MAYRRHRSRDEDCTARPPRQVRMQLVERHEDIRGDKSCASCLQEIPVYEEYCPWCGAHVDVNGDLMAAG